MMKQLYLKLARRNLKQHKTIYKPYLIAGAMIVGMCYILSSIQIMVIESGMKGVSTTSSLLELSRNIFVVLALIILFYMNSFIVKRRKKELGLYAVLGLERRHIAQVMAWEVFIAAGLIIGVGILFGVVFSYLMFLLLMSLAKLPTLLTFRLPLNSVGWTVLVFAVQFAILLAYNVFSVYRMRIIALLASSREGEREPKTKWILTLVGAVALGAGYYLAQTVEQPLEALGIFFPAVLLVIIGTYALFTAGSIFVLKALKRNKRFYYRPRHFISVSGMIYRMKQNAAGLASICILSTCALVTLSSVSSIYIGKEDVLAHRFPREFIIQFDDAQSDPDAIRQAVERYTQTYGMTLSDPVMYRQNDYVLHMLSETVFEVWRGSEFRSYEVMHDVKVMDMEAYVAAGGTPQALGENEVLMSDLAEDSDHITVNDHQLAVKTHVAWPEALPRDWNRGGLCVVSDSAERERIFGVADGRGSYVTFLYNVGNAEGEAAKALYFEGLGPKVSAEVPHDWLGSSYAGSNRKDFYQVYGSVFFVGIFFVVLFILGTALIIYYKQVTEGYDDQRRFHILQQVGMSHGEVRKTISSQVRMVFFLPLMAAVIHMVAAFHVICRMLTLFEMYNTQLYLMCTLVTVLLFSVFYYAVYQYTARVYYRIVER